MRLAAFLLSAAALTAGAAHAADAPPLAAAPAALMLAAADGRLLGDADRAAYRTVFAAIRAGDWATATAGLDARPQGALTPVARAELILARGAPRVAAEAIVALLATAPDLPEAPALAKLARARGAADLPSAPIAHDLVRLAGAPKRQAARPTRSDAVAAALSQRATPLIKANDGAAAEPLVEAVADQLAPDSLAEFRQRVAWAYFLANDDAGARRVATLARAGSGDWAVQADWVLGLAAWRSGDMEAATQAFAAVAGRARDAETVAAGLYWAARGDMAGGHPDRVAPRLRSASRLGETFYGMLADATLGLSSGPALERVDGATAVLARADAHAAAALAEIGETALADQMLRQQARIGDPAEHGALLQLAQRLQLPATQIWLAQNGPSGFVTPVSARYPLPAWAPANGWRVDRALCMAHALQESQLRIDAVSRAGARGLMQLMPGTARLVARHRGDDAGMADRLGDPAINFEYGQSYLEELAGNAGTGGLLPKVIAAYNAGPNNVAAWALRPGAATDPLLFIESIPFAETRAYVAIVLRNYWMYQRETGAPTTSLAALAQGQWPRFPRAAPVIARTALRSEPAAVALQAAD